MSKTSPLQAVNESNIYNFYKSRITTLLSIEPKIAILLFYIKYYDIIAPLLIYI